MRLTRWIPGLFVGLVLAACSPIHGPDDSHEHPAILLFKGVGASSGSVEAWQDVLVHMNQKFHAVDSEALNAMSASKLRRYRLLIFPGGNFEALGNSLTPATTEHIRSAVRAGTNYLGICAGAFFAGDSPFNGLNLAGGARFSFYSLEHRGVRKAAIEIAFPKPETFEHYWEDGPELSGWGEVVAKYPDGTPAVAQGKAGQGWMLLTGFHPEASERWRGGMDFHTPVEVNRAYAAVLVDSALNGKALPHF